MIDTYIYNLAMIKLCAVIWKSVSPKLIELHMEMPCWCLSEGHQHGGCQVAETSKIHISHKMKSVNHASSEYPCITLLYDVLRMSKFYEI